MPRSVEFALLFLILPLAFALLLGVSGEGWFLLPGLWVLALICLSILVRDPSFERHGLFSIPGAKATAAQLRKMGRRFVAAVAAMTLATLWFAPEAFFKLPQQRPALWLLLMLGYPLLSVLPQGFIWRVFFVHRYARLFRSPSTLLMAGALSFALAHLVFQNALAVVATAIGGAMFLQTYLSTRSMLLATLEHAAYGLLAFTLGFGRFLYHGAIPMP